MNAAVHQVAANDPSPRGVTLADRARRALVTTSEHTEEALRALAAKHVTITAITSPDARADCHSAYMEIKNTRVEIEKAGKDARDDATKFSKAVIEEEKRLVGILEREESRLKAIRDAYDAEQERIRLAEAEREVRRVQAHQGRIVSLRAEPAHFTDRASVEIMAAIERIRTMVIDADFEEFRHEAEEARRNVLAQLSVMLTGRQAQEAEKVELERLRAEKVARDAKDAEDRAKAEATARAEAQAREKADAEARAKLQAEEDARRAAERAALDRQRAEQETQLRAEREAQEKALAAERADAAKRLAEEQAAARAQREAEDRRIAAERAAVQRDREDLERKERERQEALDAVDAKIAANAGRFYAVLVQLRDMLILGSAEAEVVETALREAGLDR